VSIISQMISVHRPRKRMLIFPSLTSITLSSRRWKYSYFGLRLFLYFKKIYFFKLIFLVIFKYFNVLILKIILKNIYFNIFKIQTLPWYHVPPYRAPRTSELSCEKSLLRGLYEMEEWWDQETNLSTKRHSYLFF